MENKNIILQDSPGSKEGAIQFLRKLRDSDTPQLLVQELGAHDVLLAMREADDEQRADLLTLCTKEQFCQMVDFSCWEGFDPQLERLEEFVAPLVYTGLGGSIRAIDKLSNELKTLLFKNRIVVHLREDRNEELPYVPDSSDLISTSDGYYGIEILDSESCPDVMKELIRALIFKPFEEYQLELEAIRHDFKFELMEDALRWRTARLADLGFGSYEEGLALLSPRDPKSIVKVVAKQEMPHPLRLDTQVPAIYREHLRGSALFDASYEMLSQARDEKWQERAGVLGAELSAMVSLFLTGIKCDLADVDAIAHGTELARDILGLGLNAVAKNAEEGAKVLAYVSPGNILQAGMGLLVPLRERARKLAGTKRLKSISLDTPWQIVLDCLCTEIPMWWPSLDESYTASAMVDPLPSELESLKSVEQVHLAEAYLDELVAIESLLEKLAFRNDDDAVEVQLSTLVLTLLANAYVDGKPSLDRVALRDAQGFTSVFLNQSTSTMLETSLKVLTLSVSVQAEGPLEPAAEPEAIRRLLLRLLLLGRDRLESEAFSNSILTV